MRSAVDSRRALQELVDAGCKPELIKFGLKAIQRAARRARKEEPLGRIRHEAKLRLALKTMVRRLSSAARSLRSIQEQAGAELFLPSLRYCGFAVRNLLAETILLTQGGGRKPRRQQAITWFTVMVHRHTKRWCDAQVSLLIEEALGESYTQEQHNKWRRRQTVLPVLVEATEIDQAMLGLRLASLRQGAPKKLRSTSRAHRSDVAAHGSTSGSMTITRPNSAVTRIRHKSLQESD